MNRYSTMEAFESNSINKINAVEKASGMYVKALVDENIGGIIGYLLEDEAEKIVSILNETDNNA